MAVLLALLSAAVVAGCGSSDRFIAALVELHGVHTIPTSTATKVLQRTAEEAIAAYLRSSGHEYVGSCRDGTSPTTPASTAA